MIHLLGIAGSMREGSYNLALLHAAAALTPADCELEVVSIRGIPLYDGDVEARAGVPAAVQVLKQRILAADGLLLGTPEYNGGIPGPFKNALDWLTRPPADIPHLFHDRPVALCGVTPGMGGTRYAQLAWLPVLRQLGMRPWFGKTLALAEARKLFDAAGQLQDEKVREQVRAFIAGFARFAAPPRS